MSLRRNVRFVALTVVMIFCVSLLLGGCSSNTTTPSTTTGAPTTAGTQAASTEPQLKDFKGLKVDWYIHYDWFTGQEWGTKTVTKWIQDNKGVTVNFISSGSAAKQKLSTMIASDELPDIIQMDRGPEADSMVKNGMFVPYDDFYKKYPNLMKWAGEKVINALRSPIDGKFYGFPNWYTNPQTPLGSKGWVINRKVFNELGQPKIETYDDLYTFLVTVKEKFPGIKPMSTLNLNLNMVYASFKEGYIEDVAEMGAYVDGEELKPLFLDPAYQEFLKYCNKLAREGLLAVDEFSMKPEQIEERLKNGKTAIFPADDALNTTKARHEAYQKIDPTGGYITIYPPIKAGLDRTKVKISNFPNVGWNINMVTTKAEDPEAIYAFMDWLTGEEGQVLGYYGPQGLYWDEWTEYNGLKVVNVGTDKYLKRDTSKDWDVHGLWEFLPTANGAYSAKAGDYLNTFAPRPKDQEWDDVKYCIVTRSTCTSIDEFLNVLPDPTTNEGIAYNNVKELFNKQRIKAILAKSDEELQKAIDDAIAHANTLGFDATLKYMTEQWKKNAKLINGN